VALGALPIGFLTFHKEVLVAFTASLDTVGAAGLLPPPWDEPEFPYNESLDNTNDMRQSPGASSNGTTSSTPDGPSRTSPTRSGTSTCVASGALHRLVDQKFDLCLERNDISFAQLDQDLHPIV
jgi:hypothetical protein